MESIWKPYYFNLGTAASVPYTISIGGSVIYSGVSHKRPDAVFNQVQINDIVANYLYPTIYDGGVLEDTGLYQGHKRVTVTLTNGATGDTLDETFIYDYSGKDSRPRGSVAQIADVYPYGVPFLVNIDANKSYVITWKSGGNVVRQEGRSGITRDVLEPIYSAEMYGYDDVDEISLTEDGAPVGSWKLCRNLDENSLLYCNAFGGWEIMPLVRCKRTDNYKRRNYSALGAVKDYAVEMTAQYACITPYLKDAGAANMYNLLSSPYVYLIHAEKNNENEVKIKPVRVIDTSCEHKTFINNGAKLIQYDFVVEDCDTITRR